MDSIFHFTKDIKRIRELLRSIRSKKIVFTNGCFDILHFGHVRYLERAKELGDILIVGLNSDSSVRRLKGEKRPIVNENARAYLLSRLKPVDYVIIFEEDTPIELIRFLKPDIHVKGGDYKAQELPEYRVIKEYGGDVYILPFEEGFSTTNIVEKIIKLYCSWE